MRYKRFHIAANTRAIPAGIVDFSPIRIDDRAFSDTAKTDEEFLPSMELTEEFDADRSYAGNCNPQLSFQTRTARLAVPPVALFHFQ